MKWSVQFLNERLGLTARYTVEAAGPAAAVSAAEGALAAAQRPVPAPRGRSLFQRAQRAHGDDSGWVLYRIGRIADEVHTTGSSSIDIPAP